ncbi:multi-sensor hybrid histidine kinase [Geobacter metallireducens RCH3]|uniref:histidine kinase n=2 Tax=Geobacter metallireducens TaxID=28232 RepID=Q39PY9_GEOMG|nr:PAS domain S-box protein [Geobacter metallireducens]ABB33685.2 sensor histidine kinase response regulator, Cache_1, HAMP, PAS, PAS, PAS, PAS and PAS domain-containing [Geobacter metallireducens GS-15]EHP85382.1 multi-sensor hybrid histidine kinase [Geobacter metallireducens RCH3]
MRPLSLKSKMSITVFLLVAVLMSSLAFFSYGYFEGEFKRLICAQQFTLVSSLADEVDDELATSSALLRETAKRMPLDAYGDPLKAQRYLDGCAETLSVFDDGLSLFSPEGTLMAATPHEPNLLGKDYSYREYFRQTVATGRPHISIPYCTTRQHRNPAVMFTVPLFGTDGKLAGILAGSFDLLKDNFLGKIEKTRVGKTGYLYTFNADRRLITHPDSPRILETVPVGKNIGFERALQGFEGSMENVTSRGNRGITSFKRLRNASWTIAAHYPVDEAYAPVHAVKKYLLAALVGAILLSIFVVRLTMAYLTAPLLHFTRHVANLGDMSPKGRRFSAPSRDEIGTLAETFNAMVARLEKKEEELKRSKELYQVVADFSTDMAVWRNSDGTMAYVSPHCFQITGYTDAEFYADPGLMDRIIHPDDRDLWIEHKETVGTEIQATPLEFRIVTKANEVRWVSHFCRFVHDEAGELIGVRGSFSDISAKKMALDVVIAQKNFAENLISSATAPIFVLDSRNRILFWNKACEELTGYPAATMIGTDRQWQPFYCGRRPTLADVIIDCGEEATLSELYEKFSPSQLAKEGMQAEGWYLGLGGKNRYILFDAAPIRNAEGELVAAIETFHDITDRQIAEDSVVLLKDFYLTLFEEFPALIWRSGTDAKCNYFNKTWLQFTGRSLEEELGGGWAEGVHPEDLERCVSTYLRAFDSREPFSMEYRLRCHDGDYRWIVHTGRPFQEPDGAFAGYIGVCYDITDRRRAAEKLRESQRDLAQKHKQLSTLFMEVEMAKKEWEQTLDCIGDLVILTDNEGHIRRCNRAVVELAGLPYQDVLGREWRSIVLSPEMERIRFTQEGGELFHRLTERWFFCAIYPFRQKNESGMSGSVVTLHDTTELKKVGEALEKAYGELKEAQGQMLQREKMASIGQLAAGVAHEINNPIGFIMSNLGTLGKYLGRIREFIAAQDETIAELEGEAVSQRLAQAKKTLKIEYIMGDIDGLITESLDGAERVKKIVQDLKGFSRVDEAEVKVVDLRECLDSTINIVWNELKYKATLKKEYGDVPPLRCNPQQLNQVFMNLLVNAGHAIESQGEITVRTWREGEDAFIAISDTGCGIPEEIRARIFEPFFTTKEVGKGTGLGLSISYDIVKKHGGEITVESEQGRGTTFTVRSLSGRGTDMDEQVRILCVDDEMNVLRSLGRMFLDDNYDILTASSAAEGLEILERESPVQIVISDYRMPVMNGVDFLRKVCTQWPDTVRIVLSGYADTAAIVAAINEGQIYKFVPKPWTDDELRVTVINALEKYQLQKHNAKLLDELSRSNEELVLMNENLEAIVAERTEEVLFRNRALSAAQNILDALPVGVLGMDTEGTVVQCNRSAARLLGLDEYAVVGRGAAEALSPEICAFIDELAREKTSMCRLLAGVAGVRSLGVYLKEGEQEGIVLVFNGEEPL